MARDGQQPPNRWTRETEEQVEHQQPDKGSLEARGLAADEGRQRDSCKQEGVCDMPWPLTSNELMAGADATQRQEVTMMKSAGATGLQVAVVVAERPPHHPTKQLLSPPAARPLLCPPPFSHLSRPQTIHPRPRKQEGASCSPAQAGRPAVVL